MNYVIEFGEYFYVSGRYSRISSESNIVLTEEFRNAYWFENKEDAIKISERFGGIVRQFTIVVED